ncbi:10423_t:CDS:1, partial [Acaulospora morrowiae]
MTRRNSKITKSSRRNTNPTTVTPQMKITLFPPTVTKDDFLGRPSTNLDTKSPNAFFVYRKAFVKHLSDKNLKFRMTEVSKLVSYNWKNESKEVKAAYTKIAQEIDKEFQERKRIIRGYKIVCDPIMTLDPDFLESKEGEKREKLMESREPSETAAINNSQPLPSTTSPIVKREESVNCHSPRSIATPESSTTEYTLFDSDSGSEQTEQDFPLFEDMHREVFYNTESFSPCLEQYEYQHNLGQYVQSDMCYLPAEEQPVDQIWVDESSHCGYINDFGFYNTTFSIEQDPSLCHIENYGEYQTWNR